MQASLSLSLSEMRISPRQAEYGRATPHSAEEGRATPRFVITKPPVFNTTTNILEMLDKLESPDKVPEEIASIESFSESVQMPIV